MKLLNVVIFAEDYEKLVTWYKEAFDLDILLKEDAEYHYTELGFEKRVILGITPAKEIKHELSKPRNNSSVMQIEVADIEAVCKKVAQVGGKVLFGPSKDEQYNFTYGGVTDIEGNEIWLIESSK